MYKLLKDSLKIRRYLLVTILVIQFISVILSTLLPYMNGMFVDMLIDIKNVEEVIKYAITIAGVGIISLFLSYIYNLKIMKVKNNISFEIFAAYLTYVASIEGFSKFMLAKYGVRGEDRTHAVSDRKKSRHYSDGDDRDHNPPPPAKRRADTDCNDGPMPRPRDIDD